MQDISAKLTPKNLRSSTQPQPTQEIQLIVIDLDGTTVGETNQIQSSVKQALLAARDQGVQVAIATGRMYRSALRFHQDLELTLPLMAYQGALIKDPATNSIHRHLTISREYVAQLLEVLTQPELQAILSIHLYIDDCLYVREITDETEVYAARSGIQPIAVGDLQQILDREPTKLLALSEQIELIDQLFGSLRKRYTPAELYLTKSVATFLEATNPLVNKGTAVQYLAEEILGLQAANVMTIGDNFNDLEMLQYAGVGVAMGNAPDGVKAIANWIAPTVEEDGVVAAIEQFVL
ncbi:MAG: Cof-type HAD-IIB family hydrolase [Elainellaceae cyanobacterium]